MYKEKWNEWKRGIRVVAEWIDSRKLNTRSLRILSYMRGFPYSDFCSAVNAIVFDSAFCFSQV